MQPSQQEQLILALVGLCKCSPNGQTKGKKMNTKQDVINALEMVKKDNSFEKNGQTVITLDVRFVDMILSFLKNCKG